MAQFITLRTDGTQMRINVHHIISYYSREETNVIKLAMGSSCKTMCVAETPEEIDILINQ